MLLVLLAACGAASPPPTAEAVPAIERVLDDWHDAASRADEARYFGHFTPDAIFLGTDATERWTVPEFRRYAHPHFAVGRAWSFRAARRDVVVDPGGRIAWFDEDLATEGLGPARGSGVLLRGEDGRWRIAQYNLAITIPNERFPAVRDLLAAPPEPPIANEP
jgi:ketosteroid isomerase-like protein